MLARSRTALSWVAWAFSFGGFLLRHNDNIALDSETRWAGWVEQGYDTARLCQGRQSRHQDTCMSCFSRRWNDQARGERSQSSWLACEFDHGLCHLVTAVRPGSRCT